jgi:hypothetical protein
MVTGDMRVIEPALWLVDVAMPKRVAVHPGK